MTRHLSLRMILIAFGCFLGTIIVACQPSSQGTRPTIPVAPNGPNPPNGQGPVSDSLRRGIGPSDTGGGNGCNGNMYEGYIVDPTTLPAYKKYLLPMIENYDRLADKLDEEQRKHYPSKPKSQLSLARSFKLKTWYFACVELKKIEKDVIGVSFTENDTQQIAFQNEREIWFSEKIFNGQTEEQQGISLRHEFLMALYFTKFKSLSEICKYYRNLPEVTKHCQGGVSKFDAIAPPENARPLREEDYQNIRTLGHFLRTAGHTASLQDFEDHFLANGFDARFFKHQPANFGGAQNAVATLTSHQVVELFSRSAKTQNLPNHCSYYKFKSPSECQVTFEYNDAGHPSMEFTLRASNQSGEILKLTARLSAENVVGKFASVGATLDPKQEIYVFSFNDISPDQKVLRMVQVYLKKTTAIGNGIQFALEGFAVTPMVVTATKPAGDKSTEGSLHVLNPKRPSEDTIIVAHENSPEVIRRHLDTLILFMGER